MITLSLTRGRFYNAQHQNPAVLHPLFSSETAITLIISHNGLPQHLRACKSLNVILCTWDTFVCGMVFSMLRFVNFIFAHKVTQSVPKFFVQVVQHHPSITNHHHPPPSTSTVHYQPSALSQIVLHLIVYLCTNNESVFHTSLYCTLN